MMMMVLTRFCVLLVLLSISVVSAEKSVDIDYRIYPRRTSEEAVVLEWGNSAIISALDGSVAHFGPQTNQAALLEVECQPVLASPLNGVHKDSNELVTVLDNADEVHGNAVVMTNQQPKDFNVSGWTQAKIAKNSGAVALLVVNVDVKNPDEIYRLEVPEGESADDIDIPVVMISYTSGTVLTSATVTKGMKAEDIVNNGMPDRIRLYAAGDRSFFEDVAPKKPSLFLIHHFMTQDECERLIRQAEPKLAPAEDNLLEFSQETSKLGNVQRATLWQGLFLFGGAKAIEDRIDQVTGFPAGHVTDFMVDKYEKGSFWNSHYDSFPTQSVLATITVYLNEEGCPIVYPSASEPAKILPRTGMAIVHHNLDDKGQFDFNALQAILPNESDKPVYIARKYVLQEPIAIGRRLVLPILGIPLGLPSFVRMGHDLLCDKFGPEQGSAYFDKALVVVPIFLVLSIIEGLRNHLQAQEKKKKKKKKKEEEKKKRKKQS